MRRILLSLVLVLVLAAAPAASAANPIRAENARAGTPGWQHPEATGRTIEGYFSEVSAAPGQSVHLHVSATPGASYRVELYRLGWYGGVGARRVACIPDCEHGQPADSYVQPPPDGNGEVAVDWPTSATIAVGRSWVSGYYLAKLVLTSGPGRGTAADVPLIVRAPAPRRAAILVQAPVNTWEAYNSWGGKSLYHFNSSFQNPSNRVSFNRPYRPLGQRAESLWSLFQYEVPLVRFLERNGYDVSYTTDLDVDRDPGELLRHRLIVSAGHDEYWTKRMRDAFERARALGTNLVFMGANDAYWQIRYEAHRRTIVGYKTLPDPEADLALKTVRFRDLVPPRPECSLTGGAYEDGTAGAKLDYTVAPTAAGDPWLAGTGLRPGMLLPGTVGYEWDAAPPCAVPQRTILFSWSGIDETHHPSTAAAVRYRAASGARVFSAGSLQFVWALDDGGGVAQPWSPPQPAVQRFMRNAFADLTRPAAPADVRVRAGVVSVSDPDPRVSFRVYRHRGSARFRPAARELVAVCARRAVCRVRRATGSYRYAVVAVDRWSSSEPVLAAAG